MPSYFAMKQLFVYAPVLLFLFLGGRGAFIIEVDLSGHVNKMGRGG